MRVRNRKLPGFSIFFRQLLLLMCLMLLTVSVSSVSYMHMRQKEENLERAADNSRTALQAYVTSADTSLQELEHFLFETFRDNPDLNILQYETSPVRSYQSKTAILDLLDRMLRLNGSAKGAFISISGTSQNIYLARYLNGSNSVKEAEGIRRDILFLASGDKAGSNDGRWIRCTIGQSPCMIWMTRTGSVVCGAWITCDAWLENCSHFIASENTDPLRLISENGETIAAYPESAAKALDTANSIITIDVPSRSLAASIRLDLSADTPLSQRLVRFDYVWYVTAILLVIIIIVLSFQVFMYYPILRLSSEVHTLKGDDPPELIHEDYRLRELAVLSHYINQTIHKLREMKIRNYEALLSEQQTEQEYLLMRHKTHFFINCISVIHALANDGNDTLISELAVSLTDYLRKIDYENQEFVRLDDELGLIHSYIHIQQIRFGDSFRFIEEVPIDLFEAQIPPLILQTFVENAVEHARIHETDNLIRLTVGIVPGRITDSSSTVDMLVIDIADNGSGFPEAFRQELENPVQIRRLSQGHGVGISNAIARLKHIYHGQARITITNEPGSGAHIHMCLPILDQNEPEEI